MFLAAPISILFVFTTLVVDPDRGELEKKIAEFAPVDLKVDTSKLDDDEKLLLAHLVEAGRRFDQLFYRQVSSKNEALLKELEADKTPLGKARLRFFEINKGPWDRV